MTSRRLPTDAWLAALTLLPLLGACSTDLPAPGATVSVQPPGVERVDLVGALDVTNDADAPLDTDDTSLDVESPEVDADLDADDVDDDGDARRDTAGDGEVDDGETDVADTVMPPTVDEGPHGFGADTTGGNGGMIYVVTSTLDSGAGTLREALEASGRREIHFDIDAPIVLATPILITSPEVTVDGATDLDTPVTITGHGLSVATRDVILRHVRIRPTTCGALGLELRDGASRVLVDHCSITWSGDEGVDIAGDPAGTGVADVTLQWSLVAESLDCGSTEGAIEVRGLAERISLHHNVLASTDSLSPQLRAAGPVEFVHGFVYNPGDASPLGSNSPDFGGAVDIVGNHFVRGQDTPAGPWFTVDDQTMTVTPSIYLADNLVDASTDPAELLPAGAMVYVTTTPHVAASQVPATATAEVEAVLLPRVGATLPCRDTIDADILARVADRTSRLLGTRTLADVTTGAVCPP